MWYLYSIRLQMSNLGRFSSGFTNSPICFSILTFSGLLIFSPAKASYITGTYICRTTDILMINWNYTVHGTYLLLLYEIITVYPIEWRKSLHRYGKEILLLPNMKERMVRTTKNVSKAFSKTFNNGIKDSKRLVRGGFNS